MAASPQQVPQVNLHDVAHAKNLEYTLQELQAAVKEHEDALKKVSRAINVAYGRNKLTDSVACCSYYQSQ
jgi:hypothetical protein